MKAYITSRGTYSDWTITGVFSSKEKAQEYIDSMSVIEDDTNHTIDEYEVDSDAKPEYAVVIIYLDNNRDEITKYNQYHQSRLKDRDVYYVDDVECAPWESAHYVVKVNSNLNKEVMIKAAYDKIAEYKAQKEGI